ncbi:hypothetical protein GCM10010974_00520 [Brevibacterium sediminis]|uniref:Uncharacterized protein n=1 Tax=Brevibacterium sediminis TaxID=1857024 RepID=A0ABQ1LB13_9MICO|nr:hypothetical protein GCM10010974_00520 [Brevibacterium sediminis]
MRPTATSGAVETSRASFIRTSLGVQFSGPDGGLITRHAQQVCAMSGGSRWDADQEVWEVERVESLRTG